MKRILLSAITIIASFSNTFSQNLSYSCPRDITLGCGVNCLIIKGKIPDIKSQASDYIVSDVTALRPCRPADPALPGPSANITIDDTYSALLTLPFTFNFYGQPYTQYAVGPNGTICFDAAEAGTGTHWTNNGDPPQTSYDRALIMGPYHDIDMSQNTSPTRQVKYEVLGTAPNRILVVSYYKIPLFSCTNLIENTHQIIIYETSNIIEVWIGSKQSQQCPTWNGGKAIVGLQDFTKTKGIVAPGRGTTPNWGSLNMNETWRFIPKDGQICYRSAELLDATGTVIATSDTTRLDAGTFELSFPNICPATNAPTLYVIKTTYARPNDLTQTFFSLDTITVTKTNQLPFTTTSAQASCGQSNGSITVTTNGGQAPYNYQLDGGTGQSSNIFTGVTGGAHTVTVTDALGCTNTINVTVTSGTSIPVSATQTGTSCPGVTNGTITVNATSSSPTITYVLDGTRTQVNNNVFTNVASGSHTVVVTDSYGCTGTVTITVTAGSALTATLVNNPVSCTGVNNGSATLTPTNGTAPYSFQIDGGPVQVGATGVFNGLATGSHTISWKDANGCTNTRTFTTVTGTLFSASTNINQASCAGAANGSITVNVTANSTSGGAPLTYSLSPGPTQSNNQFSGLNGGTYTITVTDGNGCIRTLNNVIVATGAGLTNISSSSTATSCNNAANGTITVTVPSGTAPYQFSLDGGTFQPSATNSFTFNNVSLGPHVVSVKDANNCPGTVNVSVTAGPALTGTAAPTNASCTAASNGSVTITPNPATGNYSFALDGGAPQTSPTFNNLTPGVHSVVIADINTSCTGIINFTVGSDAGPTGSAVTTNAGCATANNGTVTLSSNGPGGFQYAVDGGTFGPNATIGSLAPGAHIGYIKDNTGCTATVNFTINAGNAISGSTAVTTATSCANLSNGSVVITPGANGQGIITYSLDGGVAQTSTSFTNLAAGPHSILITDENTCTETINITVQAGAALTAQTPTVVNTTCPLASNGVITIIPSSGISPYSFDLDNGTQVNSTGIFNNLSANTYSITFTDFIGCTGTVSATVAPGPNLTLATQVTNPQCANISDGTITASVSSNNGTPNYLFSLNGGPNQLSSLFSGLAPNSYTITVTDAIGCTGTATATLTSNPALTIGAVLTQPLCNGQANGSIVITAGGGVATYQYSKDLGINYQSTGTFNNLAAGTYNFRIKDNVGCTKDTTITLGEPPLLTAFAVGSTATCSGNDGTIDVTAFGGTTPYSYSIDNGITFQASSNFIVSFGNYNNIIVKDNNGCTTQTSTTVVLTDNMFVNAGLDTTICFGITRVFNPIASTGTTSYTWYTLSGILVDTIKNGRVTPLDTTTYVVKAIWGVCSAFDTVTVNVLRKPIPNAGRDKRICIGDSVLIGGYVRDSSGSVSYHWSPPLLVTDSVSALTLATPDSTTTLYTLTVTDNYGCNFAETDQVIVNVQPPVPANAGRDTIAMTGTPHQLMGSGGVQYLWSPASVLNNPNSATPMATLTEDTWFTLQVRDVANCIGYDTVFVKVLNGPTYYVPNAFSPNGDGLNDIFRAIPSGIYKTEWFRVFNRYGQLVFETNQWLKGWDGTFRGKKQAAGTYIWMVKGYSHKGNVVEMKGTVMIVQ